MKGLNDKFSQGSSPLLVGAKYGNVEVVKLLLKDERVDVGLVDNLGRFTTPPPLTPYPSQDGARGGWRCRLQLHQRDQAGDPRVGEKRDGEEERAEECSEEKVDDETR